MQSHIIWDEFLKIAKEEAGSQVVETWFKAVSLSEINVARNEVTLCMPNNFVSSWIQEHYHTLLLTHLKRLLNTRDLTIIFSCASSVVATPVSAQEEVDVAQSPSSEKVFRPATITKMPAPTSANKLVPHPTSRKKVDRNKLNSDYVFDSFIVGPSNSLAHGAAYAVSQALGKVYNPLFIYGGTGLGKTHLLHAIGNEAKRINPSCRVRYQTSDQFMRDFIQAIRFDKAHYFRERYQNIDLLLIDDIQFFSNKEQTQEMFFHIFNTLYENKKQIVLSSDTFPEEIKGLQKRITSRMEWGLVADMQTPNLETKIAILTKKAEQSNIILDEEVSHFIASRVLSNIRQLEGALIRVDAFASLTGQKISLPLAQRVLLNLSEPKKQQLDLASVAQVVAKRYGVTVADIKSKNRKKTISEARHVSCFFMKKLTPHSLQTIGTFFGGRDHSTIIHAIGKIESRCKKDTYFFHKLKSVEKELTS